MLTKHLFRLSPRVALFDAPGSGRGDPQVRAKLANILTVFVAGYNAALAVRDQRLVAEKLTHEFDAHHVGFAFEGAGMCYALFDLLAPWTRSRLRAFTNDAGRKHDYIATVGAGFAVARVPWGELWLHHYLQALEATVAWCVLDGYGFHQGIFHRDWFAVACRAPPAALPPYARQLFDSGIGRSFWWTQEASPNRISRAIERFPEDRRAEMWSGVGMAASYAGGVEDGVLRDLLEQSGEWSGDFLSGVPFAARMRQKGENPSTWTDRACLLLLQMRSEEAANILVEHVNGIAAELIGRERELRERGYGLLRRRLRRAVCRRGTTQSAADRVVREGKPYGTRRQR
jgi:enediyne biosynthesis protein E3